MSDSSAPVTGFILWTHKHTLGSSLKAGQVLGVYIHSHPDPVVDHMI